MTRNTITMKDIFSTENSEDYEGVMNEGKDEVATSQGEWEGDGPDEQEITDISNVDTVDDILNDEVSGEIGSIEELEEVVDEEEIPDNSDVQDMTETLPDEVEEGDVEVDEDGVNVSEPVTVDIDEDGEELGIDPEQAIECIIRSREEDITIIRNDTEVTLGEKGEVSIDKTDNSDSGDDDTTDIGDDDSSDDNGDDSSDDSNDSSDGTSTESYDLMDLFI